MSTSAERMRISRERRRKGLTTPRNVGPPLRPKLSPSELFLNKVCTAVPAPNLAGAACDGLWQWFDPRDAGESEQAAADRHQRAMELCAGCPALAACSAWIAALPARERPIGVVAGRVVDGGAADA